MMWLVAGWNTFNDDYDNYVSEYSIVQSEGIHSVLYVGYQFIQNVFVSLGCDYATYRIAIYGIFITFLGIFIYRWSSSIILALIFYILFHFLRDCVETRNFIASIFILLTLEYFGKPEKSHWYAVILLLLTGFSIHMTFVLYFVFLLVEKKEWNYWALLVFSFIFSFIFKYLAQGSLFSFFIGQDDFLDNQVDIVLSTAPKFAVYATTIGACFNGLCLTYFRKQLKVSVRAKNSYVRHLSMKSYSYIINNINALTNIFIIMTTLHGGFYGRLFANMVLLNVIYFINVIKVSERNKNSSFIVLFVYMVFYCCLLEIQPFQLHLHDVFTNNSIF